MYFKKKEVHDQAAHDEDQVRNYGNVVRVIWFLSKQDPSQR